MTSHLRTRARAREASDIGEPGPEENITKFHPKYGHFFARTLYVFSIVR